MYLARRFRPHLWESERDIDGELTGDVAKDVCTNANALSFWRCPDRDDAEDVALALATGRGTGQLEEMFIVLVPETDLAIDGTCMVPSLGDTAVAPLAQRHVDITKLTFARLQELAKKLASRVRDPEAYCCIFTKDDVKRLVDQALSAKRFSPDDLSKKLRAQLHRRS